MLYEKEGLLPSLIGVRGEIPDLFHQYFFTVYYIQTRIQ